MGDLRRFRLGGAGAAAAPLLSPPMALLVRHRLLELIGMAVSAAAFLLAVALVSHDRTDPSWNLAGTAGPVRNILGPVGANVSDALLQGLGVGAYGLAALALAVGLRIATRPESARPLLRLSLALLAPIPASMALAGLPSGADPSGWFGFAQPHVGGAFGQIGLDGTTALLSRLPVEDASRGLVASAAVFGLVTLALILTFAALGIRLRHLIGAGRRLGTGGRALSAFAADSASRVVRQAAYGAAAVGTGLSAVAQSSSAIAAARLRGGSSAPDVAQDVDWATSGRQAHADTVTDVDWSQAEPHPQTGRAIVASPGAGPQGDDVDDVNEGPSALVGTRPQTMSVPNGRILGGHGAGGKRRHGGPGSARHGDGRIPPSFGDHPNPGDTMAAARRQRAEPRADERQTELGLDPVAQGPQLPPVDLLGALDKGAATVPPPDRAMLDATAAELEQVLGEFGVRGRIVASSQGPVVTLYELEPAAGTKSSRVIGLADDIARSMSAASARIAIVQGRNVIGIELPNARRALVRLRDLLDDPAYGSGQAKLPLVLGRDIAGRPVVGDLARMPHLLVAGTTGSGKSVAINAMILSLLYRHTAERCRLILIDPKMLELSVYDGIPHLMVPVVTDPKKAATALKWAVREMENRYRAMSRLGVRNIDGYNIRVAEARSKGETLTRRVQTGYDTDTGMPVFEDSVSDLSELPYIVIVVDEMADLMLVAGKDIEAAVQRLSQMARAAGIHIIMATQRPSVDVITGTIKSNFPTRISFHVTSKIDSRTILGEAGAEQLLGQGDMLYMASAGRSTRVHGPLVRDDQVEAVVAFLRKQGEPHYVDAVLDGDDETDQSQDDPGANGTGSEAELYEQAVAIVLRDRKPSTSYVQRRLSIGYNRAASLIERMEDEGIISAPNHAGRREVLRPNHEG